MSLRVTIPPLSLVSPEGLCGFCPLWFVGEGASLLQTSLVGEVEIQVSLRLFQAAVSCAGAEVGVSLPAPLSAASSPAIWVQVVSEVRLPWERKKPEG